jgi:hypothetical protein
MRAQRLRLLISQGVAVVGIITLATGCASASSSPIATPTMTPSPVPALGKLTLARFPSTASGLTALELCEGWATLRGQYVAEVRKDTPYQLDVWFSGPAWSPLFTEANKIGGNLRYASLTLAFGQATDPMFASIGKARSLDHACARAS